MLAKAKVTKKQAIKKQATNKQAPKKKIVKRKKEKGKHSSPETSGIQNLPGTYIDRVKNTGGETMKDLVNMRKKGMANRQDYAGKWTDEDLEREISEFFEFCAEHDVKPAKAGIRMWLGLSRSQYHEWETNKSSHPLKSDILEEAHSLIEMQYLGKIETYPTGNIFLLKSAHGHSDKQEIQVTSGNDVNTDKIAEAVKKLGLGESQ